MQANIKVYFRKDLKSAKAKIKQHLYKDKSFSHLEHSFI